MPRKRTTNPTPNPGPEIDPDLQESITRAEEMLAQEIVNAATRKGNPLTIGARVLPADEIATKLVKRASDAADDWFKRVKNPKKHPLVEGIKAEGKYADKMKAAIAAGSRAKALAKVSDEDYLAGIDAAGPGAFSSGIERKRGKVGRRFAVLQPLYVVLAQAIDKMPIDTESQREAKMRAARRGMIMVGKARRGEVSAGEIATEIAKLGGGA